MVSFALGLLLALAEPVACPQPNALAHVVFAYPPETPREWNRDAAVIVGLDLDAKFKITKARVLATDDPVLNAPALAAARHTAFAGELRDCVPQAGSFKYLVTFPSASGESNQRVKKISPMAYLAGRWACRQEASDPTVEQFTYDDRSAQLTHEMGDRSEMIVADGNKWHLTGTNPTVDLRADFWTEFWMLRGQIDGKPGSIVYRRETDDSFQRMIDTPGGPNPYRLDVCHRKTN